MIQVFLTLLLQLLLTQERASGSTADKRCDEANLRNASVGYTCITKNEHKFQLVYRSVSGREVWRDLDSGILWGDKLSQRIRRRAAADLCAQSIPEENKIDDKHLSKLPTLEEYKTAENHGFREVLPNMKDHFYWIDSIVPGAKNIGHVFNGSLGKAEIVVYRSINFENIRCISRVDPRSKLLPIKK